MTRQEIIKNSSLPILESELLLAFILHTTRENIITYPNKRVIKRNYNKFKILEKKRLQGYSIAHLIQEKEFFSLSFKVNTQVLIPRPETELLVEKALEYINNVDTVIDLGTGSGAIIISLAKNSTKTLNFYASDISSSALKVSKENLKRHHLTKRIKVLKSNLLSSYHIKSQDKLLITANLPYLKNQDIPKLNTIQKEPLLALQGGKDGLKLYKQLFTQLSQLANKEIICLCEFDPSQYKDIINLSKNKLPYFKYKIYKDLNKKYRLLILNKKRP